MTSGSRASSPTATTRRPRRISSRATSSACDEARAAARADRARACAFGLRGEEGAGGSGRAAASAEAAPDRLPGGVHAKPDGGADHGGRRDRAAEAAPSPTAFGAQIPAAHVWEAARARVRSHALSVRRLPLPGDVRLSEEDADEAARARPAR